MPKAFPIAKEAVLLHLSDLHFGRDTTEGEETARVLALKGLIDTLLSIESEWQPNIICITGDIGWKGRNSDYESAASWLASLNGKLGISSEAVFCCPGNHDVFREAAKGIQRPNSGRKADKILTLANATNFLEAPFDAFTIFCRSFGIPPYQVGNTKSYLIGTRTFGHINIVSLNTAWFARGSNERGKLWLGLPLIQHMEGKEQLCQVANNDKWPTTIVLLHHPKEWLHEEECTSYNNRKNTFDYICTRCDMILSGHAHGEIRKADMFAQAAWHLSGGATFEGADHFNTFRLIRIADRNFVYRSFELDPKSLDNCWCPKHAVESLPFRTSSRNLAFSPSSTTRTYLRNQMQKKKYTMRRLHSPVPLSGLTRIQIRKRLGQDWKRLSQYFNIPSDRYKLFRSDWQSDDVLEWLEETGRLDELPKALADIDRDDLIDLLGSSSDYVQPVWKKGVSPFPGLRRLTPEDAPIFFGRYREIKGLLLKLIDPVNRFIAITGASGAGKSSLVAAGLRPQLSMNAILGSKDWLWLEFTPGESKGDPFRSLAAKIEPWLRQHGLREEEISERLKAEDGLGLNELAQRVLEDQTEHAELLLFVDQFEEIFTRTREDVCRAFIRLLTTSARCPQIRIIVALREDFYKCMLDYPELAELLRNGSYPLSHPGQGELYEMIVGPAMLAGLRLEEGLEERILEDTGTGPGALALMAFALAELYRSRGKDGRLTFRAYNSFGGVQKAIGKWAERTFQGMDRTVQATLPVVFRELVRVDEEWGAATRRPTPLADFAASPASLALIDHFVNARLLVRYFREDGTPMIDVVHEALFSNWPSLKEWITSRRDDLHRLRQLQQAAREWERSDRQERYIWSDERAIETSGMLRRLPYRPTDKERDFLGPLDPDKMIEELNNPRISHERRAVIGVRLDKIGDTRRGVGLRIDGLPDIDWCRILGGEITLKVDLYQPSSTIERRGKPAYYKFKVKPFCISKYPITWLQYRSFLKASDGYHNLVWWQGLTVDTPLMQPGKRFQQYNSYPVEPVAWIEAVAFCRWMTARMGYEIRLPTEWEWQQAATGGNPDNVFPWGAEWDNSRANSYESGLHCATVVGSYPNGASLYGVLDMSGNVWECCANEYEQPDLTDLSGDARRVVRGGSWFDIPARSRTTERDLLRPGYRRIPLGFRVASSSLRLSGFLSI